MTRSGFSHSEKRRHVRPKLVVQMGEKCRLLKAVHSQPSESGWQSIIWNNTLCYTLYIVLSSHDILSFRTPLIILYFKNDRQKCCFLWIMKWRVAWMRRISERRLLWRHNVCLDGQLQWLLIQCHVSVVLEIQPVIVIWWTNWNKRVRHGKICACVLGMSARGGLHGSEVCQIET